MTPPNRIALITWLIETLYGIIAIVLGILVVFKILPYLFNLFFKWMEG